MIALTVITFQELFKLLISTFVESDYEMTSTEKAK